MPIARTFVIRIPKMSPHSLVPQNANWCDGGNARVFVSLWLLAKLLAFFVAGSVFVVAVFDADPSGWTATFWHFRIANKIDTLSLWSRVWNVDISTHEKIYSIFFKFKIKVIYCKMKKCMFWMYILFNFQESIYLLLRSCDTIRNIPLSIFCLS